MAQLTVNGIGIEYQCYGDAKGTPLLLIQGMGTQLVMWPVAFIDAFVAAGFRVVAFDSRDCGLSEKFDAWGPADLPRAFSEIKQGVSVSAPYSLEDMADDAAALIAALGYSKMHVAGLSNGGAIAQILALRHADKVQSLTLMMSTSARRGLPKPAAAAVAWLGQPRNPQGTLAGAIEDALSTAQVIGSSDFPSDKAALTEMAETQFRRNYCAEGFGRHFLASLCSGDKRVADLASISQPVLIVQGRKDPLVPEACAEDLHNTIEQSRVLLLEGMAHDLPAPCIAEITAAMIQHCRSSGDG